ncbi:discoidin domain-containing receptor 2-like isoform X1 [Leptopilina heterotoma]|uniref:discoidin domain-containing receptor 2-like isoform X1 n=1 Tax=Leptopilina heterotoma TaxID=63436 RepID=UPI001CA8D1DF|nr:discoidin domain-containing receptor 2-like isoform X1 [Leptopilina heterotoma]
METVVLLLEVLIVSALSSEEPIKNVFGQCLHPLGMEEGKIPDDAITASSSYEMKSVGPQNARIRQEKNGGAWCPKAQISGDVREYLEVDLTQDHLITWTETQGRFGNGQGQEYAESFSLEYWRGANWRHYKNLKGDKILRGNSNTYLVEKQKLDLPFVASRVRFVPYSQHPRTVCMRVEIYGCVWEERIVRYIIPKGETFGPDGWNLEDTSYDGSERDDLMVDGLGQLIDGIIGEDPEILVSSSSTNWVGWNNLEKVEIIFEFNDFREFENCTIHVAHVPKKEVEVFSSALVWFSFDGLQYQSNPEKIEVTEEIKTSSISVSIPLLSRVAKFIKLELKQKSKWLMISEVNFETRRIQLCAIPASARNGSTDTSEQFFRACENESESNETMDKSNGFLNETVSDVKPNLTPDAFPINNSQTYIGLISGALTVGALLLTCTVFLMKQRGRNKVALLQKHTALLCGSPKPGITINMKDIKMANPIVVNGLSQSRLSIKSKGFFSDDNTIRSSDQNSEYEHCSAYERTYKLFSEENLAYEPASHKGDHYSACKSEYSDVTDFTNERNYQDELTSTPFSNKRHSKTNPKVHEGYYAATDILTIKRRQQRSTSSLFTPLQIQDGIHLSNTNNSYNIQHVSRHRLRIMDKLGEGSFGLVHLCEAKGVQCPDLNSVRNRQVVIVRSLWRGVTDSLKKDFMKDMHVLAAIRDINVARIIALVEEEPFGAVFEYGELGDLPSFIKSRESSSDDAPLSYACQLNFVTQIASGMKYLENLNIPHCDLAARNCVVSKNLILKVSDHAMYCSKYDQEYYVNGYYAKVPLRWMAWEAILLGKQTCQADVWSYAITVWEILTLCKDMPYSDFTSEQVLENCSKWYHSGTVEKSQPRILSQPQSCSRDLYHMMTKCWSKHAEERPTFEEICLFLKRLGFD